VSRRSRSLRGGTSAFLDRVIETLQALKDYWPLTLRQVYYQLVAAQVIPNTRAEYQRLSRVLTQARLEGSVPWEAIEDRVRQHLKSGGWPDAESFVDVSRSRFLEGYRRDLLQGQPHALEVWVEKDALSRICHEVAFDYCVPLIVARGFSSISYVHECRRRVLAALEEGKESLEILYFGDLDPSGWEMLPSMLRTLRGEMDLGDAVGGVRCALTPEQVGEYDLPTSVDAMKDSDTRSPKYRRWLRENGHPETLAVELDALPPDVLAALVRDSIESRLDWSRFEEEREREREDRDGLAALKNRVETSLEDRAAGDGP